MDENQLKMYIYQTKIMLIFFSSFEMLKSSVDQQMNSNSETDKTQALKIFNIVESYLNYEDVYNAQRNIDKSMYTLNKLLKNEFNEKHIEKLSELIASLEKIKLQIKDNFSNNYKKYYELKKIINKKEEYSLDNVNIIRKLPDKPIDEYDFNFLSELTLLTGGSTKEIKEATKKFNTLTFKNTLKRLYHEQPFYFEQAFGNADIFTQKKALDIIKDYHKHNEVSKDEDEALQSLIGLNILSDIDTLANKYTSKISIHQAFDALVLLLKNNNNPNVILKILNENIIMDTLFNISVSSGDPNYGLRNLFMEAHYPFNELLLKKYTSLKSKDGKDAALAISSLMNHEDFKKAFDKLKIAKETLTFKTHVEDLLAHLVTAEPSKAIVKDLERVVDGLINRELYSLDVMSQQDFLEILNHLYYYRNKYNDYDGFEKLDLKLESYFNIRLKDELENSNGIYHVNSEEVVYGLSPGDIWIDVNNLVRKHNIKTIETFNLKYENSAFTFKKNGKIKKLEDEDFSNLKYVGKDEITINAFDNDKRGFEVYIHGVYSRMIRDLFKNKCQFQKETIEKGFMSKKEIPGLSDLDIKRIKKIVIESITLSTLYVKSPTVFSNLYVRKVGQILETLEKVSASYKEIEKYVDFHDNEDLLHIFRVRGYANRLLKETKSLSIQHPEKVMKHADAFLHLIAYRGIEEAQIAIEEGKVDNSHENVPAILHEKMEHVEQKKKIK